MKSLLLLVSLFLIPSIVFGQFGDLREMTSTAEGVHMICIDVDSDGRPDVVGSGDALYWFRNLGQDKFSRKMVIRQFGDASEYYQAFGDIISTDFNADGKPDILHFSVHTNRIVAYLNEGGGQFGEEILIDGQAGMPLIAEFKDLNGDNQPDLFTRGNEEMRIYFRTGTTGFTAPVITLLESTGSILFQDMDNDMDADMLVSTCVNNTSFLTIHDNDGSGNFSPADTVALVCSDHFVAADFEGDGDIDLFYDAQEFVYLLRNTGGNVFSLVGAVASGNNNYGTFTYQVSDINGDGIQDVLTTSAHTISGTNDFIQYSTFNANGTIAQSGDVTADVIDICRFVVVDIDLDGRKDVVSISRGDREIAWYKKNTGTGFGGQRVISEQAKSAQMRFADINNDSYEDLIFAAQNADYLANNYHTLNARMGSSGGLSDSTIAIGSLQTGGFGRVCTADIDHDNDLDLIYCNTAPFSSGAVILRLNDGNGFFGDPAFVSSSGGQLAVGDIDNDGWADVVVIGNYSAYWLKNLGNGTFSLSEISNNIPGVASLRIADMNNDGLQDILYGNQNTQNVVYLPNTGTEFGPAVTVLSGDIYPHDALERDIDGDGDNDVVIAFSMTGDIRFLQIRWNNGAGVFDTYENVEGIYQPLSNLSFADLDGDGTDELCGAFLNGMLAWFHKTPDHHYTNIGTFPKVSNGYAFSDTDHDGDPDVVFLTDLNRLVHARNFFDQLITGNLYVDENQNGMRDSLEAAIPFRPVHLLPAGNAYFTDETGNYRITDYANGVNRVQAVNIPYFDLVSDSGEFHLQVNGQLDSIARFDFGYYPNETVHALNTQLTGGFPRCNQPVGYWISLANAGTTHPAGIIHLQLADSLQFITADIAPDSVDGQHLYWHYDSLSFFATEQLQLQVQMPDFQSAGHTLTSYLYASVLDAAGNVVATFADTLDQVLVCAYDPNDKTASPAGLTELGYIPQETEWLEYTVRFQNTGSDTAIQVKITDQLSEDLDWSSLEILSFSKPVQMTANADGQLTFLFNHIYLPHAEANEAASHGFVRYRIRLNEALAVGTQIPNAAQIYFDYNPAVHTNTVLNTLVQCTPPQVALSPTEICMGSALTGTVNTNGEVYWEIPQLVSDTGAFSWLADTAGVFELLLHVNDGMCITNTAFAVTVLPTYSAVIDTLGVCAGDSISIFGTWRSTAGLYTDTLQTQHGCDSIRRIYLLISPTVSTATDTLRICAGDSISIFGTWQSIAGMYADTLQTQHGCDSIRRIYLQTWDNPLVQLAAFGQDTICRGGGILPLPLAQPAGGIFTGNGVLNGQFDPESAGIGTHQIRYIYTNENGCIGSAASQITVEICLGMPENTWHDLQIFPNPTDGKISVTGEGLVGGSIVLLNSIGQQVLGPVKIATDQIELDLSALGRGIYLLQISGKAGNLALRKLVVE